MFQDVKSIHRNHLHFYILTMKIFPHLSSHFQPRLISYQFHWLVNLVWTISFLFEASDMILKGSWGAQEKVPLRNTQKFPHLDSCITPHCDSRAGEGGLWSQTAKPRSETCHLLKALSVSASLPVGIRIVFPCGAVLRIQWKVLALRFAQGKYSVKW